MSNNNFDPAKRKPVSRRTFLGVGATAIAGSAILAACGDATTAPTAVSGATTGATTAASGSATTAAAAMTTAASGGATTAAMTTAAAGGTTAASGAAAAATYSGPAVELAFWNGFTGGAAPTILPKLMDQFNSSHPNIKVTNNTIQWADYYQKVPAAVQAGQGPDIGAIHGTDPATFAAQNLILPLDDMIQTLGYSGSDFVPAVFNTISYKDKKWAIPFSVTPLGLYYNKKVLSDAGVDATKPPQTNADYMSILTTLKGKGVQGSWVDPFEFTGNYQFQSLLWQFGGDLYSSDVSTATFNSDAGVQALTWMVDLIKQGYSPANVGQDADFTALTNGKTAFNWNGVWQTSGLAQIPNLQWGAVPAPQIGTKKAVWSSSTHLAIFNKRGQDPNKVAAAKVFIDWMVKNSLQWAQTGELPASTTVRQSAEFQQLTALQPFAASLEFAHFETAAPGIGDPNGTITTAVSEAVLMKKSPKQALDDAVAQANKLLQQNRQQYGG